MVELQTKENQITYLQIVNKHLFQHIKNFNQ